MLQVQKVDARMDGYGDFKYRVKFESYHFGEGTDNVRESHDRCAKALLNCCEFMNKQHGFGPELSLTKYMEETPVWAIRSAFSALHTYKPTAIYLRDDYALEEFNNILSFYRLQGLK